MIVDRKNAKIKLYGGFISETKKPLQLSMIMDMKQVDRSWRNTCSCLLLTIPYLNMMDDETENKSEGCNGTAYIPNVNFDGYLLK